MKKLSKEQINVIREHAIRERARRKYEHYVELVHHGHYEHFAHTRLICKYLQRIAEGEQLHLMIELPPRHGKQQADNTPVYTPNGWTTHGQLSVGDYVYHPSGKAIKVLWTSEKTNSDWIVTFSNGEQIRTHECHEWTVYNRSKQRYETLETQDMKDDCYTDGRCKYQLQNIEALENSENRLPIDPYTFGVWLGDGSASKPCITYDQKDYPMIQKIVDNGYPISTTCVHKDTNVPTTYFSGTRHNPGRLTTELKNAGVMNNKHIPDVYLQSSIEQRLQLLAGLVDSDGHRDNSSRIIYSTTNEHIRDGVYQLALSLGFRPYIIEAEPSLSSSDIQGNKTVYQIGFNPTIDMPTQLERKTPKRFIKQRRIGIKDISYQPNGEQGNCIQVDSSDGLYLTGNTLIPTHNSMTVTETFPSYYLGRNPDKRVITSAYNDDLARKFGRLNRNKFSEFAHNIFNEDISGDNSSTSDWGVRDKRGGMISTGIGGSITGQGADCFVAGTLVDTEIGKVDIKDLHEMKNKPKVLSYNHKKKKQEYKKIVASREVNKKSYHMSIKTQEGNVVTCTPDHPFYIEGDGYVPICKAKVSGKFLTSNNTYDISTDFDIYPCDNTTFYDIQVEDNHNFYASNLLVHNCLIIDDPIKNAKEALSKTIRENIWNEWESTLSTRLHDGASVIVIMTRWHEDDLIGRLLESSPYDWERIRLPAIAEDKDDKLGREIGDPLCPELGYGVEWANLKKQEVGSRTWSSLYQQRPAPAEGAIFQRNWFKYIDTPPARCDDLVISWDFAFKNSDTSDYVAGQVWQKTGGEFYCIDQIHAQMDFTQSVQAVVNLKNKYPRCRTILIEDKANGPAIINTLKQRVSGIIPITPRESKVARAYSITPYFEAGNVYFKNSLPHLNDMVEEIAAFDSALHDDQVDAMTQALNYFAERPAARVIGANAW